LERLILTHWYEHPAEHWADLYVSRNELDHAIQLRQSVAATVGELFAHDPTTRGYVFYNLGCFYARAGQTEPAIEALQQALVLVPSLVEHSKQDSDLDTLRDMSEFQALYAG
jgi:tetratricopeptide (TPR) repeat protein